MADELKGKRRMLKAEIEKQFRERLRDYYIDDSKYKITVALSDLPTAHAVAETKDGMTIELTGIFFDYNTGEIWQSIIQF